MIQSHLHSSFGGHPNDDEKLTHTFSKVMMDRRIRSVLCLLATNIQTGLPSLDEIISNDSRKIVRDVLEEKHPDAKRAQAETMVSQSEFHPVLFESITPEVIRKCAPQIEGAVGPSGVDAMNWRCLCTAFTEKFVLLLPDLQRDCVHPMSIQLA